MVVDSKKARYILKTYLPYSLEVVFKDKIARDKLSEKEKRLIPPDRKAIIFEECPLGAIVGLKLDLYHKEIEEAYFIETNPLLIANGISQSELEELIEKKRTKENSLVIVIAQGRYDYMDEVYYRFSIKDALWFESRNS
ncbi:hypothetical protein KY332_04590 [Candidatus Woesearchaeota archaeon]|nr:hypothetical protein [Candidatus Woesearchaeota archaeon]